MKFERSFNLMKVILNEFNETSEISPVYIIFIYGMKVLVFVLYRVDRFLFRIRKYEKWESMKLACFVSVKVKGLVRYAYAPSNFAWCEVTFYALNLNLECFFL